MSAACALPRWSSGPPCCRAQRRDMQPATFPTSWRKLCATSSLSAKREKVEGEWEGGKEKVHSCCPIHLGLWSSACGGGRGLRPVPLYAPPVQPPGMQGEGRCRVREGTVCGSSTLALPPLGLDSRWPQGRGGGEQEPPGVRTAAAAGNRDVRSPPLRAAPGGQRGKVQRKPRSQGTCLFVNHFGGRAE